MQEIATMTMGIRDNTATDHLHDLAGRTSVVGATVLYASFHNSALFSTGPVFTDYDRCVGIWPAIASAVVLLVIGNPIAEFVTRKLGLPPSSLV